MKNLMIIVTVVMIGCASNQPEKEEGSYLNNAPKDAEHHEGYGYYKYYYSDGSLAWDLFYTRMKEVPESYYIYYFYERHDLKITPMLWRTIGNPLFSLDSNDIEFQYTDGNSNLELIFSPNIYSNTILQNNIKTVNSNTRLLPLGQKKSNFKEAIERWNFMLGNMSGNTVKFPLK